MNRITIDEQELVDLHRLIAAYRANFVAAQLGKDAGDEGARLALTIFEREALGKAA